MYFFFSFYSFIYRFRERPNGVLGKKHAVAFFQTFNNALAFVDLYILFLLKKKRFEITKNQTVI